MIFLVVSARVGLVLSDLMGCGGSRSGLKVRTGLSAATQAVRTLKPDCEGR